MRNALPALQLRYSRDYSEINHRLVCLHSDSIYCILVFLVLNDGTPSAQLTVASVLPSNRRSSMSQTFSLFILCEIPQYVPPRRSQLRIVALCSTKWYTIAFQCLLVDTIVSLFPVRLVTEQFLRDQIPGDW